MHRLTVFCTVFGCAFTSPGIAYSAQGKANLKFHGSVSMNKVEPSASSEVGLEFREGPEQDEEFAKQIRGSISPARVPSAHVPTPADKALSSAIVTGFNGLTHAEQRL